MKNVLIVGGAGYVGGAITDLVATDPRFSVRVYDSIVYEDSFRKPVDFVYGDIRDHAKLEMQLKWADCVVWLSALVGDGACAVNPELTKEINQDSVAWLSQKHNKRIIFMSTCSVYGAQNEELSEKSPTNPLSIYAATKLKAEEHLIKAGSNAIIFRLGTLFGVGDLFSRIRLDLVVNILTVKAATTKKISVFGGDQFRPLLHVKDVARAVVMNIDSNHKGIFNLHRQNVRIVDLAYQIRNHFPDCEMEITDLPFQDTRNYRVSSKKALETFEYQAIHSIDNGIEEIKSLLETGRIKDLNHDRYSNQRFIEKLLKKA